MSARATNRTAPSLVLVVLALAGGSYAMMQSLVVPALPVLQRELGTTPTGVAWIFTAYLLAASVATPIAGRFGDMFGKKRALVAVLLGMALGTLVAAVATTLPVMIAARTVQGLGGAIFPLAFGIVRDELPRERVAGGIALISGLLGIGGGLGIVLGGPILEHLDYHWLFWIPFAAICVSAAATVAVVPESPIRAPGTVNWSGAALLTGWLVCLLLAISEAPHWGWTSTATLGLIVAAIMLAVVWVGVESRSASPLVDMRMMRLRGVWTTNLAGLLLGVGMYSSFVLIPQFVQSPVETGYGFGASVTESGLFLIPTTLAMLVVAPLGGRLTNHFGAKLPLVVGTVVTLTAYVFVAGAHTRHFEIYLVSLLIGVGIGFAFASMSNLIVAAVRPEQTGVATGMNAVARTIGGAIGSQAAASVLAANIAADGYPAERGYTLSFALMAVAIGACLVASLAIPGGRSESAPATIIAGEPTAALE
ncbi:MAG: MFS transporter [Gaiellales bacterium]